VLRALAVALLVALACAAPASASRSPTPPEKRAIELAVRFAPMMGRGNRIAFRKVRVSTVDARYALTAQFVRDPHGSPIGSSTALLHRDAGGWRVVFLGSDMPSCSSAPRRVRVDLIGTAVCARG
jgi:hypothetical protein